MKTEGSTGRPLWKVLKPFTFMHILVLALFCVWACLTIWWVFHANRWSFFWALIAVLSIVSGFLTVLILLAKYTIYAFFSKYDSYFAQNFRSGFFILVISGILSLLLNIIHIAVNNFYLPEIIRKEGIREVENMLTIYSTLELLAGAILGMLTLYAFYRLLLGLKYYNNSVHLKNK